mgnify:CR=1 FL=1
MSIIYDTNLRLYRHCWSKHCLIVLRKFFHTLVVTTNIGSKLSLPYMLLTGYRVLQRDSANLTCFVFKNGVVNMHHEHYLICYD